MHAELQIAQIGSLDELEEWQAVERAVWAGDDLELVPSHVLLTHRRYGGLVLGARDLDGRMVGILLGFPGLKEGNLVHCSHLLGVLPEHRRQDVGYRLKRIQREMVLAQGLDLVVWTFDPLETRNARLNLSRLGGMVRDYQPNLYGAMRDELNQGLETDRFTVEWHLRHPAVVDRLHGLTQAPDPADLLAAGAVLLTSTMLEPVDSGGTALLRLQDISLGMSASTMLVEAPAAFQSIKRADPLAARRWREGLRVLFQGLFAHGYAALDLLVTEEGPGSRRCYYLIGDAEEYLTRHVEAASPG